MNDKPEKNIDRKTGWIKWTLFVVFVIILLVSLRLFLKSDWLFDYTRSFAERQINESLNGTVKIESIRGDFFRGFTIYGAELADEQQSVVMTLDSATVSYRLGEVIRSPHTLESVSLHGVDIFVEQHEDSTWNVLNLLPPAGRTEQEESEIFWSIQQLRVNSFNADITSEYLFPDGFLNIRELNLLASGGVQESGYNGEIQSLEFQLQEARLPDRINFMLQARGDDERITLESLAIETGRSMMRARSSFEQDSDLSATAEASPLSWEDLLAYTEEMPLQQDLDIDLSAEGTLRDLRLTARVAAPGLEALQLRADLNADNTVALKSINLEIQNLDAPLLTGLEDAPTLTELKFNGEGVIPVQNYRESDWAGELVMRGLKYEQYSLDELNAGYELDLDRSSLSANLIQDGEQIELDLSADEIWNSLPVWNGEIRSGQLNLATWLADPSMESEIEIDATFSGSGFDPAKMRAIAALTVEGGRFGTQPFSSIRVRGNLNSQQLAGNLSARLDRSLVEARIDAQNWQVNPEYTFRAAMKELNLAELNGLEEFPTFLNGTLEGEGSGITRETLSLSATAELDSSLVNRSPIETLRADINIRDQFLMLENSRLESSIADAEISARYNITDFTHPENRVNFNAVLKDLQPLAPLAKAETLETEGEINGSLNRSGEGYLLFDADAQLRNTRLDSLFLSDEILASVRTRLKESPEADVEISLTDPVISGFTVQDIQFQSNAILNDDESTGSFVFEIFDEDVCTLHHEGEFRANNESALVHTTLLDFTTQLRTLSLEKPFDFEFDITNQTARLDTATINDSSQRSYLSLWAPVLSADKQDVGLKAENLNLSAIQSLMIEEPLVEGNLSAELGFKNDQDELFVSVNGDLREIEYEGGSMDLFNFYVNVEDEWLQLALNGRHNEERLFESLLQVPYVPGDPATFDDQFFDRDINGYFELFDSNLSYWFTFLPEFDSEENAGAVSMRADLMGTAGNPELTGSLNLNQAVFSGIEIDSAELGLNYTHDDEFVDLEGHVVARGNPVLDMDARLPFIVDLRSAEVLLPDEEDEVAFNFRTNNFNLAIFNDFLDDQMFRQLRGQLNGEVTLDGRLGDLQTSGSMELLNGNLRVVPAGITLSDISSALRFNGERIELQQFRMRSGPGQLQATGFVEMENLEPENLELNIRGNQFRVANTQEYNALVDLNASMTGTVSEPNLTGNLTILGGYVNLQNFGEQSVEDVRLEDEEEPEPIEFYELLQMEMNVNFAREFLIRNRQYLDMEIELGGEVDLVKERRDEIQMFGTLEGVRGYARPLGKNFTLDEALVTFYGPVDDPELNIRTRFEPPQAQSDVRIFYIIEGTGQEPEFRFDSEPPLELQDIISYTLFGKPFYELESWEQVVAGSGNSPSAADLALDVLLDRVELLASQSLGIDVVQIDNSRSGSDSSTSIKTGWYLNRRTFFAVLNEISSSRPKTLFMLEYLLNENLELIITQGDDKREGVDLRWQYDY